MQDWPDALERQHLSGASSTYPHGEEDHQQCGGEHHLSCVSGRVSDRQGKGHGPSETWGREWKYICYTVRRVKFLAQIWKPLFEDTCDCYTYADQTEQLVSLFMLVDTPKHKHPLIHSLNVYFYRIGE